VNKPTSKRTKSIRVNEEQHKIVSDYLLAEDDGRKIGKFFGNAAVKEVERLKNTKTPDKNRR
jgi:hypothetical protein